MRGKTLAGFSLLEILVALTVFAFLALVATQAIFSTVKLSTKSASMTKVRSDIDYAVSVMERYIHSSRSIVPCPNADPKVITLTDAIGGQTIFSCVTPGEAGYLASNSARLTSETVAITSCSLVCIPDTQGAPVSVKIDLEAGDATKKGSEKGMITTSTQIYLRNE